MNSVLQRFAAEARFFGNTLLEATLHPKSTSVVSKTTGEVVSRNSPSSPPEPGPSTDPFNHLIYLHFQQILDHMEEYESGSEIYDKLARQLEALEEASEDLKNSPLQESEEFQALKAKLICIIDSNSRKQTERKIPD